MDIAVKPLDWLSFGGNVTLSQNRIKNYDEYVYNDDTWSLDTLHLGTTTISYSPSVVASRPMNTYGILGRMSFL